MTTSRAQLTACLAVAAALVLVASSGCTTAPATSTSRAQLAQNVDDTISEFKRRDPGMAELFENAHGYAVFPSVGKGGIGVGGAYGRGEVFERGRRIGFCDLTQGTVGLQLGGQVYSQVIFFQNAASINRFKAGELAFAAQATAVAANAGASADANYRDGVMVFTMSQGGLMYEASIGGQRFSFLPVE